MNKSKFLLLIIVVLLLINVVLVFQYFNRHKRDPKTFIIEKLHFDKEQQEKYEVYVQKHRKDVNENEAILNRQKSALYATLQKEMDSALVDSFLTVIVAQQYVAEQINYQHFLEIKNLCKPEQQADFNELTHEITHLFSRRERK